jgi:hypothetical protein
MNAIIMGLGSWCLTPLSTIFQLSFNAGENLSTRKKSTTCHKSPSLYHHLSDQAREIRKAGNISRNKFTYKIR